MYRSRKYRRPLYEFPVGPARSDCLFPPTVWGYITSFLDVREIARLMIGSCHAIIDALQVGVTHLVDRSEERLDCRPVRRISASFIARFVGLEYLHLPYNNNLNDSDMRSVLSEYLKYIDLSCNEEVTDFGLRQLPPTLETLNLKFSPNITDLALSYLPRSLKHLDLDRCKAITDEGLKNLPPRLETLKITFATQITDDGIMYLPHSLTQLQIAKNKTITRRCVLAMPPGLEILDLSFNTNLAHTTRQDFPPHLKILLTL